MDFSLSEEQQLLLESLDELLERDCSLAYIAACDAEHRQPVEFKRAMHEAGFLTLGFPEEYGGTPTDTMTLCLIAERVARQGLNLGYSTEILQVLDILEFGSEEQKQAVLGVLAEGEVPFALAFTEPGAGSDSAAMAMTAVHRDGKVVLNGTKTLVTNAVDSKYLLTMARNPDATDPRRAISMYLVPMDTPGIELSPILKMCWHTADSSEIFYNDVVVDESCLVGVKGEGFVQLMKNFEVERIMTATQSLGLAEAAFEDAAAYAAQRVQFGQPIGNFQQIQQKLTDMAIKIENMRNFVYHSAWMVDNDCLDRTQAAMCKRYCSLAAFEVCDDAMQIFGGLGVTEGVRVERLWRDARGHRFGGGTDEIMVHIVGRQIVKQHSR
ncbi:alkylation response protein AidB-like acyl-CoA dehydrogenase [Salana multivorans]|uniref:Alkylation response protein AidB-like acyl-CoA dehydrogenase n=1 Tax=Salana multivorans TaxID=120377 RepID=A0A3N2DD60_9MICO|nr:acyl-CoA dehydrogenase family protein [Salana multivorans]MBN8883497.1 acyl-CoA dehydrogenase family protein [Salana multivorans]OJX98073.1 MAG: acyl-CoA dehydrogenase [Micrococcales bacterium 73-15]ROR97731.1 alkylation response protein AidB-like acyl-CoA dehydrogenase [Salana multivorans]